jgi:hypothetical protein
MSALSIQPTYPIFTDSDGQPLEAGYVWIGQANLDPQVNPINVYWDTALTIPATQPIRTLAGYPSRNGTPARLYVNSDYSIRVMNRNGSTVYSAPAATERFSGAVISGSIDAADVNFIQSYTGSVTRTVLSKERDMVSVKDFGAVGDGVADDTAAIQLAIDQVGSSSAIFFPRGTYKTTSKIVTRYGINTYIYGGSVYDGASIQAYHADHIFQYNWTVHIDGVSFNREATFRAAAIAAQKNGIHSDDTGSAINGAAYTLLENLVVGEGNYTGIRMHGTHQMAVNCVANSCSINMHLLGAVHTLIHNSTENGTTTNLWVQGNGHRIYDHYCDNDVPTFLPPAGFGNITFTESGMCLLSSPTMNDVNGKQHIFLDRVSRSTFVGGNFYNTPVCRITLSATGGNNTFQNNFTGMGFNISVTQAGSTADCYANFFPFGTDYAGALGPQSRGYNNLHTNEHIVEIVTYIPSVNVSAAYDAWSGKLMPLGPQYAGIRGFQSEFQANGELRVLGASITANSGGASKVVDLSLKVRDLINNADLATLVNLNANEEFGADAAVDTYVSGIADIGCWAAPGVKTWWNFYLRNNSGAVTADNVIVRITCVYRTVFPLI